MNTDYDLEIKENDIVKYLDARGERCMGTVVMVSTGIVNSIPFACIDNFANRVRIADITHVV